MTKAVAIKFDLGKNCYDEGDVEKLNAALKEGYKPIQNHTSSFGSLLIILMLMDMDRPKPKTSALE